MKFIHNKRLLFPYLLAVLFLGFFAGLISFGFAQEKKTERDFLLFFKYPSVTVGIKEKIDLEFTVVNTGKREEEIALSVIPDEKAKKWDVGLETKWDKMEVHSVSLLTKDPDNSVTLRFYARVPKEVKEGKYSFVVRGITKDKKIQHSATLTVYLKRERPIVEEASQNIELTSDYPSIENPAGKEFKFIVSVKNNTDKSMVFDLGAEYPYGWRAYCSPRWEEDKKISSIKVNANGTENLLLTLIPPINISKGEYPIKFAVKSENMTKDIDLKAIVTGTYSLKMETETGRLNLEAIAGEKKEMNLYLWNEGSAPIEDISFFSTNIPKDWKISFDPEKIPSLPPYEKVKKPEKLKLSISSPSRTLPGDYMITIKAVGKQDQRDMDLRVTVKRSTRWGWVGIGIVLAIIASLGGVFARLGRR